MRLIRSKIETKKPIVYCSVINLRNQKKTVSFFLKAGVLLIHGTTVRILLEIQHVGLVAVTVAVACLQLSTVEWIPNRCLQKLPQSQIHRSNISKYSHCFDHSYRSVHLRQTQYKEITESRVYTDPVGELKAMSL